MPTTKTLDQCRLPVGKENRTVILDDNWQIWPGHLRENVLAVVPPQEMGTLNHDAYINGQDGGILGKYILVCLINLALKEERRPDLIVTQLPVGIAAPAPPPARMPTYTPAAEVKPSPSYVWPSADTAARSYTNHLRTAYTPKYTPIYSNAEPVHSRVVMGDYSEDALRAAGRSYYTTTKRAKSASPLRYGEQSGVVTRPATGASTSGGPYMLRAF